MFDARGVDFDRDGKIGAVDAVRLPPGDCELFNFNLALAGNPRQAVQSQAGLLTFPSRSGPAPGAYIGERVAVGITGPTAFRAGRFSWCPTWPIAAFRSPGASSRRCPPPPAPFPTVRSLGTPSLQAGNR